MKDKITHGGSAITTREYEVRLIDTYGDVEETLFCQTKREAMAAAEKAICDGANAVVVELHIQKMPARLFAEPDTYETVARLGNLDALEQGGWV